MGIPSWLMKRVKKQQQECGDRLTKTETSLTDTNNRINLNTATAEELESVKAMEKSGIKAMAENRFFLEKSKETEDAFKADLKSENFRIFRI